MPILGKTTLIVGVLLPMQYGIIYSFGRILENFHKLVSFISVYLSTFCRILRFMISDNVNDQSTMYKEVTHIEKLYYKIHNNSVMC